MSDFYNNEYYKIGELGEIIAAYYLEKIEQVKIVNKNDNFKYDFIDENNIKYEVKMDRNFNYYKSNFLEYKKVFLNGSVEETGINTTESDYYIFVCPLDENEFLLIKALTQKLKSLIKNKQLVIRKSNHLNAHNKIIGLNYGYIINYSDFTDFCDVKFIKIYQSHYEHNDYCKSKNDYDELYKILRDKKYMV